MTVWGVVLAFKRGRDWIQMPAYRLFTLLALCIWIPMLLSFPDTYSVKKTGGTILVFFRLYFTGLFVIWTLQDQQRVHQLSKWLAGLAAFWVADALFQAATGRDLLGFAYMPTRLRASMAYLEKRIGAWVWPCRYWPLF